MRGFEERNSIAVPTPIARLVRLQTQLAALALAMCALASCAPAGTVGSYPANDHFAMGGAHGCVVDGEGALFCWGMGRSGQLGVGDEVDRPAATRVALPGAGVDLSAAASTTCAVVADGSVWCWGDGTNGEVGLGPGVSVSEPTQVPGVSGATRVAVGIGMGCALLADGHVDCWGSGLGTYFGLDEANGQPVQVSALEDVVDIEGTAGTWCVKKSDGTVWCWGEVFWSQDGEARGKLRRVSGIEDATDLGVVLGTMCAVELGGVLKCWGLPVPEGDSFVYTMYPVVMPVGPVRSVAVGYQTGICAVTVSQQAVCWDDPKVDHTPGSPVEFGPPRTIPLSDDVTQLAMGFGTACAMVSDGSVFCWGSNYGGRMGAGADVYESDEPWRIAGIGAASSSDQ